MARQIGGLNGNGGTGPHCTPGISLNTLSIDVSPAANPAGQFFVAAGTPVTLNGSATVRKWLPDCTSHVFGAPIEWELFFQPSGSDQSKNLSSALQSSLTSNSNSFIARDPGKYNVSAFCPQVPGEGGVGKVIYAGTALVLAGIAKVWINNEFAGNVVNGEQKPVNAVLTTAGDKVSVTVNPLQVSQFTISETSGDGLSEATGRLDIHLILRVSGPQTGTMDITLSTEKTIKPPNSAEISGRKRDAGLTGNATLVGQAPIVGPPGTTTAWVQLDGRVSNP